MAKFTPDGYADKLKRQLKIINDGDMVAIAAKTALVSQVNRIFRSGQLTTGDLIGDGKYGTKEIWLADDQIPVRPNHTGKTGKRIKSSYYKSYKDFRSSQGRESSKVNLKLFGRLESDFSNSRTEGDAKPIKVNPKLFVATLKFKENQKKRAGLEDRYGKIFDASKDEKEAFRKELDFQINKLLSA